VNLANLPAYSDVNQMGFESEFPSAVEDDEDAIGIPKSFSEVRNTWTSAEASGQRRGQVSFGNDNMGKKKRMTQ